MSMPQEVRWEGSLRYFIEDTRPEDSDIPEVNMFFERMRNGDIEITIQETKRGGRTYHHRARLSEERLSEIVRVLGVHA